MDASGRDREPRPGIQCPDWCGPVHITGVRKEDITCPCGHGYYSKRTGEFISGDLVRAGKAPPKDAEEITVPERCWNDPARGGRDGQVHELPGHRPHGYENLNQQRNYSPDLAPVRHDRHTPAPETFSWLPSEDIDFDVISTDLPIYLGPGASVSQGNHREDGRPGFFVNAANLLTVSMISDLKADTLRWRREYRDSRRKDYNSSQTHRHRQMDGPSRARQSTPQGRVETPDRDQSSINYQLSREELSRPVPETKSIPRSSHTTPSFQQGPDSSETSYGHRREIVLPAPQQGDREQSHELRKDIEVQIARRLRDRGQRSISREEFDSLVDQAIQNLQATSISKEPVRTKR